MQFAGSNPAIQALSGYSGFDPSKLGKTGQRSRSMQRQNVIKGEAFVDETKITNEGRLEAAKSGIAAEMAQIPGMGEVIGMSVLEGLGNFAGPIASGMGGGISSYDQIPAAGMKGLEPNSYIGTGGKYGSFQPGSYTDYNPAVG